MCVFNESRCFLPNIYYYNNNIGLIFCPIYTKPRVWVRNSHNTLNTRNDICAKCEIPHKRIDFRILFVNFDFNIVSIRIYFTGSVGNRIRSEQFEFIAHRVCVCAKNPVDGHNATLHLNVYRSVCFVNIQYHVRLLID